MAVVISNTKFLFFQILLSTVYRNSLSQTCSINLVNRVVYEGDKNILQPQLPVPIIQQYSWKIVPSSELFSTQYDITDSSGAVMSGLQVAFGVNSSGLVVKTAAIEPVPSSNPFISTAGFYTLTYSNNNCKTAAKLVIVRNQTCSCQVINSTNAQLICSIEFSDETGISQITPVMTWVKNANDFVATDRPFLEATTNVLKSTSNITVDTSASTYHCRVNFSAPTPDSTRPFAATNAPDFATTCDIKNCVYVSTTASPTITTMQLSTIRTIATSTESPVVTTPTLPPIINATTTLSSNSTMLTQSANATTLTTSENSTTPTLSTVTAATTTTQSGSVTPSIPSIATASNTTLGTTPDGIYSSDVLAWQTALIVTLVALFITAVVAIGWWFCVANGAWALGRIQRPIGTSGVNDLTNNLNYYPGSSFYPKWNSGAVDLTNNLTYYPRSSVFYPKWNYDQPYYNRYWRTE